jgi:hypothetical protein
MASVKIPAELPAILKNFSKAVLTTFNTDQENIYEFAQRYFAELARNQPAVAASSEDIIVESETKIEADRDEQQLDAFTLKRLYSELIKVGALSGKDQIKDICYSIGMINSNVETIFNLCDNEDLTIEQLIVVATTLVNTDALDCIRLIFTLFENEDKRIDCSTFWQLFQYLAAKHDGVTERFGNSVCDYIHSVDASAISYDEFMASEVVEDFIRRAQQRKERSSLLM